MTRVDEMNFMTRHVVALLDVIAALAFHVVAREDVTGVRASHVVALLDVVAERTRHVVAREDVTETVPPVAAVRAEIGSEEMGPKPSIRSPANYVDERRSPVTTTATSHATATATAA